MNLSEKEIRRQIRKFRADQIYKPKAANDQFDNYSFKCERTRRESHFADQIKKSNLIHSKSAPRLIRARKEITNKVNLTPVRFIA